nr:hypothetical protein [Tanacetum cinerariifolium]
MTRLQPYTRRFKSAYNAWRRRHNFLRRRQDVQVTGMDDVYFEQDMDELLYYGPNKVDFKQWMKEILYYDKNDSASISGKSGMDVVLVEVLSKELVAKYSFDGDDGEQVVLDGDVILDEVYDAMVAQKEVLSASDGGVIPTEVYDAMVAQDMLENDDGDVILIGRLSTLFKLEAFDDLLCAFGSQSQPFNLLESCGILLFLGHGCSGGGWDVKPSGFEGVAVEKEEEKKVCENGRETLCWAQCFKHEHDKG